MMTGALQAAGILYPHATDQIHEEPCGCAYRKYVGETAERYYIEGWERFEVCASHAEVVSVSRVPIHFASPSR
jgi:hypothetical protein